MARSSGLRSRLSTVTRPPYVLRMSSIGFCIVFLFFEEGFKFGCADPAKLGPVTKPGADQWRTSGFRHAGAAEARFQSLAERLAFTYGGKGLKLFALQPAVVDRILQPMRGNPRGAPTKFGQFCRGVETLILLRALVVLNARFRRAALLPLVQGQHQFVGSVVQRKQLHMRLQTKLRSAVERGDLVQSEWSALGVIKGFDKGPLDQNNVEGEAQTAACMLRMRREPLNQLRTQIAQRKRAAGMR